MYDDVDVWRPHTGESRQYIVLHILWVWENVLWYVDKINIYINICFRITQKYFTCNSQSSCTKLAAPLEYFSVPHRGRTDLQMKTTDLNDHKKRGLGSYTCLCVRMEGVEGYPLAHRTWNFFLSSFSRFCCSFFSFLLSSGRFFCSLLLTERRADVRRPSITMPSIYIYVKHRCCF